MKVVLLGAGGQLAYDLERTITQWDLIALKQAELDICDNREVDRTLSQISPDIVINTAAFVKVDDAETNVETAFRVNAFAVLNLAKVCSQIDAKLVQISTDYVFDGNQHSPYTEDDIPNPLNVYGASKLTGELFVRNYCSEHIVIRTSGLFGVAGSQGKGKNFVETMINLAETGMPIQVVNDQVVGPTYTRDLASTLVDMIKAGLSGLFHVTNNGMCTWFDFATKIFKILDWQPDITPISTDELNTPAKRPSFSVLSNSLIKSYHISPLPPYQDALVSYLKEKGHIHS